MSQIASLEMIDRVGPAAFQCFGEKAQMVKTIEELAELMQVLAKRLNGSPVTDEQIVDEVADVLVMANQMRFLYGPSAVDSRMMFKLNRTANYILAQAKKGK